MASCARRRESSKRWVSFAEEMGAYLAEWKAEQKRIFAEIAAKDTAPNTRKRKTADDSNGEDDVVEDNATDDAINDADTSKKPGRPWKKLKQTDDSPVISNELGSFCDPNIFARWFRNFCVEYDFGTYSRTLSISSRGIGAEASIASMSRARIRSRARSPEW